MEREITNRKFPWIFFDLDGTLADSIPAMYQVYLSFLSQFGVKGTKEEFEGLNGPSLPEIVAILKTNHRLAGDEVSLLHSYKDKIRNAYVNYIRPLDGASDTLQELKNRGHNLLLITSSDHETALEFIRRQNWDKFFDHFVFGDEVKKAKPESEIYHLALEKANISSEAVAVIEDSPNGVKSAKGLDIFVIALANNHPQEKLLGSGANIVVSKLKDILPILEVKN